MLDRMANELSALRAADQLRGFLNPSGIQLGSNDYLGLATHPRLKSAIVEALEEDDRYCSTGSRLLTGNHSRWDALENEFAGFIGAEAALYFPTGYAANIGLLSSVLSDNDVVFSDAANHASLIDGIRLSRAQRIIVPHLDLEFLERELKRTSSNAGEKIIVVERIFSMDGDVVSLSDLTGLCEKYRAWLIIDEAHSTGVIAPIVRPDCVLATVHTCGKALSSMGAFVAGSRTLRDFLINRARTFIFTTGLPPYCAAHVHEAMMLATEAGDRRTHLQDLGNYLRRKMQALGFNTARSESQIVPLVLGSNEAVLRFASVLTASGFSVSAIRPPTVPMGTSRIRISLNANLSFDDLDRFLNALAAAREIEVVPR